MFQLLLSAYSTISIQDTALFLGMNEDDATNCKFLSFPCLNQTDIAAFLNPFENQFLSDLSIPVSLTEILLFCFTSWECKDEWLCQRNLKHSDTKYTNNFIRLWWMGPSDALLLHIWSMHAHARMYNISTRLHNKVAADACVLLVVILACNKLPYNFVIFCGLYVGCT